MKTSIIVIFWLSTIFTASAQEDSIVFEYCYLNPLEELGSRQIQAEIDTGGTDKMQRLKDAATGKAMKFKSIVELLNFMGAQGWELVSVTPESATAMFNNYSLGDHRYFMKRKRYLKN